MESGSERSLPSPFCLFSSVFFRLFRRLTVESEAARLHGRWNLSPQRTADVVLTMKSMMVSHVSHCIGSAHRKIARERKAKLIRSVVCLLKQANNHHLISLVSLHFNFVSSVSTGGPQERGLTSEIDLSILCPPLLAAYEVSSSGSFPELLG
jgi:hypothetical protein